MRTDTRCNHERDLTPKLALTRQECADSLGVGIRTVDQLIAGRSGNGFPVIHVGSKPLVPVAALEAWLAERAGKAVTT